MMQLRLGVVLVISALSLAGCGRFALNNHSLDYKNAKTLEPLKFPENATVRPFTPLYPAPTVDPLAIQHAPTFENKVATVTLYLALIRCRQQRIPVKRLQQL